MKRLLPILAAAALLAGYSPLQAAPSPEALIKEHLKAIGGVDTYKKIKTRRMKAVIEMPGQGFNADMVILSKAPDKQRTEIEVPGMGKVVEGYDGKIAWMQNPVAGIMEKTGDQLKQAQQQADFYRDVELLSRYSEWTYKGRESIDGKSNDVIEGKAKDGSVDTMYLDEGTHLLTQLKSIADTEQGKTTIIYKPSDYREVDGIKLPHKIEIQAGPADVKMTVKEIKQGIELDDSLFTKPEK